MGLIRKTGSDGLVEQRDYMVEAGRTSGRRAAQWLPADRGISNQGTAAAIRRGVEIRQCEIPNHIEFGDVRPVTDSKYALTEG